MEQNIIQKSYTKSIISIGHRDSNFMINIFEKHDTITVLQIMELKDNWITIEYIEKDDWNYRLR